MKRGLLFFCMSVLAVTTTVHGWTKMTFYDVLQEDCRKDVGNKDVGDPAGDAYFNLKDVYLPVACAECKKSPHGCRGASTFDCNNPESNGNLVVRQIEIEVNLPFGTYALCNTEGDTCKYDCRTMGHQNSSGVGMQAVCGGSWRTCDMAPSPYKGYNDQKWDYWDYNTAALMGTTKMDGRNTPAVKGGGGRWFSVESQSEGVYWRNATIVKAINAQCQSVALRKVINQRGASCFNACGPSANSSSACWISCFYETALGKNADSSTTPTGGMDPSDITTAWLKGFTSTNLTDGGCPPCPDDGPCPAPHELETMPELLSLGTHRRPAPRRHH